MEAPSELARLLTARQRVLRMDDEQLAVAANAYAGVPIVNPSSVRNWSDGSTTVARDWRPIVAITVGLGLNKSEADQLLAAAGWPDLDVLASYHPDEAELFRFWVDGDGELARLLWVYQRVNHIGHQRLADIANAYAGLPLVTASLVRSWSDGSAKVASSWRPIVAVAAALRLSESEADQLLIAAGQPHFRAIVDCHPAVVDRHLDDAELFRWWTDPDGDGEISTSRTETALVRATSVAEVVELELTDSAFRTEEQQAALFRSAEVLLLQVIPRLEAGSWSTESGFDYGAEREVEKTVEHLRDELYPETDRAPNDVMVAQLEQRLNRYLLDLERGSLEPEVIETLKRELVDRLENVDATDDLADLVAVVNALAFSAEWDASPGGMIDDREWNVYITEYGKDPLRIFSGIMGWISGTELEWQDARNATAVATAAISAGLGFTYEGVSVAWLSGVSAIVIAIVSSTVWYVRARLQPKFKQVPDSSKNST